MKILENLDGFSVQLNLPKRLPFDSVLMKQTLFAEKLQVTIEFWKKQTVSALKHFEFPIRSPNSFPVRAVLKFAEKEASFALKFVVKRPASQMNMPVSISKKGPFKVVVFGGKKIKAHAVGLGNFSLANYESSKGSTFFVLANVNSSSARIMVADNESKTKETFVIEGLPFWFDCHLINFAFLRPFCCTGNMVLRQFVKFFDADL